MKRIHLHWTGGGHTPNASDLKHYHFVIAGNGDVVQGNLAPESNLDVSDGQYVAHTRKANTGAIGIALAGMFGAVERPFDPGTSPITTDQLASMAVMVAELCETYDIPVTRKRVLTHAEIEPTLGVKQRGKWDITWLPGMAGPGDPVSVGDRLRDMVKAAQAEMQMEAAPRMPEPAGAYADKPRKSPAQSKTIWAQVSQWGGAALAGGAAWFGGQSDIVKLAIVGGVALIVFSGIVIFRERIKHWAAGVR